MNLIKKGYAFKCLYALFWPVCPALIGRVARHSLFGAGHTDQNMA